MINSIRGALNKICTNYKVETIFGFLHPPSFPPFPHFLFYHCYFNFCRRADRVRACGRAGGRVGGRAGGWMGVVMPVNELNNTQEGSNVVQREIIAFK